MKRITAWATVSSLCVCWLTAGCDQMPGPIRTKYGLAIKQLAVNPNDAEELEAATDAEKARVNYGYRLTVLQGYYEQIGHADKLNSASKELKNIRKSQWFQWQGVPEVLPPTGETIGDGDERLLVEYMISSRNDYKKAISKLYNHYLQRNDELKARMIRRLADRLDFVRTYSYFAEAEIPDAQLRPVEVIPEAERMYKQAMRLHWWGKLIPLAPDYRRQRDALHLLLQLVNKYPHSTKIALSAYHIGEIYKEYFNENLRAVRWYERAWQWDSAIPKPARFQAAVVWDLRLQEHEKAIELYKQVIEHEQFNTSNVNFARNRLEELTQIAHTTQ